MMGPRWSIQNGELMGKPDHCPTERSKGRDQLKVHQRWLGKDDEVAEDLMLISSSYQLLNGKLYIVKNRKPSNSGQAIT